MRDIHDHIAGMVQQIRNRNEAAASAQKRRKTKQQEIDAMLCRQRRRIGRGHIMGYLVRAVTDEQTES